MTRRRARRDEDRGPNLAEVRATTERLCELITPFRAEQRRMAVLLEQLHAELCEDESE